MKKFLLISCCLISTQLWAQSYNGPESVDYDAASNRYFISNTGTGQILARETDGALSVFATTGSGPHGLEVIGNEIYACSGSRLKAYDLATGAETVNINLGAGFANGITHKGDDVFVTDFSNDRIYRYNISSGNFNTYISNFPSTPNGIYYDDIADRMLVVSWGANAPIYQIDLADSSYTIATNTSLGYCDGIAMDNNGDFYVSAWSNDAIHKFAADFTGGPSQVVSSMSSPADIYYNRTTDTLAIPNSGNNTVVFVGFGVAESWNCVGTACIDPEDGTGTYSTISDCESNCSTSSIIQNNFPSLEGLGVGHYPNPIRSGETIQLTQAGDYQLYNQQGKEVWKGTVESTELQLPNLPKGVYILKNTDYLAKLIIQ